MPVTPEPPAGADAGDPAPQDLAPEDAKLVTLARAARARSGAAEGAAVRDDIGRTYVAVTVELPSLRLSAAQAAVVAAVASGQQRLEALAVVGERDRLAVTDRDVVADVAIATVVLAGPDGVPHRRR